jgi:peptidyl-prolyl cis-trans isomerase D
MLQRIRDGLQGSKVITWAILGAIALTFVFWGGSGALDPGSSNTTGAARVDDEEIPAFEATRAWSEAQNRWATQVGTEMTAEQRAKFQEGIIDNLVLRKVIETRLRDGDYRVSDKLVLAEFQNIPAFQDADGKYDSNQARLYLQQTGKSEREFFNNLRDQMLINQLQQGLGGSYFLTRGEAQRLFNLENEEREVQYAQLAAESFAGDQPVDDSAVKAYYEKNGDRFMTTESVALEYAELRLESLAAQIEPSEADLRKVYDDNRANYVLEERRRARHILIPANEGEDAAALKKAESVLAEARAGKDFAELAKQHSTDVTAASGGELGFVEHSQFPGPFGDTLFGMKVGDISGPVKSQFGYHIIKLEEIQPGEARPFESVRAEIDSQYRQDRAAGLFGDRQEAIAERIEKGESDLDKLAKEYGLVRGNIPEFLRGGGAEPLGSGTELQQLVFADAALNQGKIAGPLALGEDRLVLIKVTEHHKAEVKPLDVVRDEIVALVRHERGAAAAKAAAEAALPRLTAGEKLETLAQTWKVPAEPARFVSRGDPSIPAALRTAIFDAPRPGATPVVQIAALDDGSTAVFVVTRSRTGDASGNPQLVQQQNAALQRRLAEGDLAAYINAAKSKAEIVKNPKVFE